MKFLQTYVERVLELEVGTWTGGGDVQKKETRLERETGIKLSVLEDKPELSSNMERQFLTPRGHSDGHTEIPRLASPDNTSCSALILY
jgi:hypothetical protein